jgi:hypothetical protein
MHCSATTATPRRAATSAALALALAMAWLAWGATPARAQMIMGITTNSFTPGSSTNSLDVTLTNTGTSPTTIAGFSFGITAASNNVTFESVTDNTVSVANIFAGNNSLFGSDITLNVSNNGQTISGANNFATRLGGTTLAANQTLGLGNVLFALSPTTNPLKPINITFTSYPTSSLSDPTASNISVGFAAHPQFGPTSVPELPPTALVVTGLLLGVGVSLRRLGLAKLLTRLGSH